MSSINIVYMLQDVITGVFTHRVGKWQGTVGIDGKATDMKALLVLFKIKKKLVKMLIHAPANYVGVYIQEGKRKWKCISYHDSCWRNDGVERFLFEHRENIRFAFMPFGVPDELLVERITDTICVIKLSEEQLAEFSQIRNKKYK